MLLVEFSDALKVLEHLNINRFTKIISNSPITYQLAPLHYLNSAA